MLDSYNAVNITIIQYKARWCATRAQNYLKILPSLA